MALMEADPRQPGVELGAEELLGRGPLGRVVGDEAQSGLPDAGLVRIGRGVGGAGGDVGHGDHRT
jgi:hypothetical protein